jgi:hypothetical protein
VQAQWATMRRCQNLWERYVNEATSSQETDNTISSTTEHHTTPFTSPLVAPRYQPQATAPAPVADPAEGYTPLFMSAEALASPEQSFVEPWAHPPTEFVTSTPGPSRRAQVRESVFNRLGERPAKRNQ